MCVCVCVCVCVHKVGGLQGCQQNFLSPKYPLSLINFVPHKGNAVTYAGTAQHNRNRGTYTELPWGREDGNIASFDDRTVVMWDIVVLFSSSMHEVFSL